MNSHHRVSPDGLLLDLASSQRGILKILYEHPNHPILKKSRGLLFSGSPAGTRQNFRTRLLLDPVNALKALSSLPESLERRGTRATRPPEAVRGSSGCPCSSTRGAEEAEELLELSCRMRLPQERCTDVYSIYIYICYIFLY